MCDRRLQLTATATLVAILFINQASKQACRQEKLYRFSTGVHD
jgi:hypothetical protein